MNAKQFAWLYLVDQGAANARPSFYGGMRADNENAPYGTSLAKSEYKEWRTQYTKRILDIGMDWDKTAEPIGRSYSQFDGTFADPSEVEHLVGKLVLKDGSTQQWIAAAPMGNVFQMMANFDAMKAKFTTLFGNTA